MSLANKLTIGRILLIPVFLLLVYVDGNTGLFWAAVVFTVASITDVLDGYVARKTKNVSDFGKIMDPIADKLLVLSAVVVLVERAELYSLVAVILVGREILVSGIRLVVLSSGGEVIAASWLGKAKTVTQDIAIVCYLMQSNWTFLSEYQISNVVMAVALIFTIWSTVDYMLGSRNYLYKRR